jgi:hypothetical protein
MCTCICCVIEAGPDLGEISMRGTATTQYIVNHDQDIVSLDAS